MLILRDYQERAISEMETALAADRESGRRHAGVCSAAVGAGKSILIGVMAKRETEEREGRVLVLCNVKELVEQDAEKIELAIGERPDVFSAGVGRKETGGLIVVASVQSLARDPLTAGRFTLILADEAHGINPEAEGQWRAIIDAQGCDIIGFTGTPWRLNSGPIYGADRLFDRVTTTISIEDLQNMGHLVQIQSKARSLIDGPVKVKQGEYDTREQEDQIQFLDVIHALDAHCAGRQCILIFVPGVQSGTELTSRLLQHGEQAAEIYGHTPINERERIIADFKAARIRYMVNCGTLTTGFDCPRIDCVVLLRKTMSGALLVQMVGRGLRPCPPKRELLLLDYAGNFLQHPAVQDIEAPIKGKEPKSETHRVCPKCEELVRYGKEACPCCGYVFPKEEQERELAFGGKAHEMRRLADMADHEVFTLYAQECKAKGHKPVAALVRYKEKFGRWPSTAVGQRARHPFAWTMVDGKRACVWQ